MPILLSLFLPFPSPIGPCGAEELTSPRIGPRGGLAPPPGCPASRSSTLSHVLLALPLLGSPPFPAPFTPSIDPRFPLFSSIPSLLAVSLLPVPFITGGGIGGFCPDPDPPIAVSKIPTMAVNYSTGSLTVPPSVSGLTGRELTTTSGPLLPIGASIPNTPPSVPAPGSICTSLLGTSLGTVLMGT